jgi:hypothetical protein
MECCSTTWGLQPAPAKVELYNGRAMISLKTNGGVSEVSVASKDVPTVFLKVV